MRTILCLAGGMVKELLRKKDFYVLFILMIVLLVFLSLQTFFDVEGISRYIRDLGYTLVMLFSFIIAVTFCAKQLPSEIASGTIYPLLAKPVSRFKVVLGKFCGGFIVSAVSFTLFYGIFAIFCFIGAGETGLTRPALIA